MTDKEELGILRDLAWQHCQWCADCEWYDIIENGLRTDTSYTVEDGKYIAHNKNDDCQFAQYWARKAKKYGKNI